VASLSDSFIDHIEISHKYAGYIEKSEEREKGKRREKEAAARELDYAHVKALSASRSLAEAGPAIGREGEEASALILPL